MGLSMRLVSIGDSLKHFDVSSTKSFFRDDFSSSSIELKERSDLKHCSDDETAFSEKISKISANHEKDYAYAPNLQNAA